MSDSVDLHWQDFAARHEGHPFLDEEPLYALTEPVITALAEQMPDFFSPENEWFERDLARSAGQGFFFRRVIGGTDGVPPVPPEPVLHDRRKHRSDQPGYAERVWKWPGMTIERHRREINLPAEKSFGRIAPPLRIETSPFQDIPAGWELLGKVKDLQGDILQNSGEIDSQDRRDIIAQWAREAELLASRPDAYSGWLLQNRQFRTELVQLRKHWGSVVEQNGEFPASQTHAAHDGSGHVPRDAYGNIWRAFFARWCLETMLTWELPLPLRAEIDPLDPQFNRLSPASGVSLFVPWSLVRGGEFDLMNVLSRLKLERTPAHLREWVQKKGRGRDSESGDTAYLHAFQMYRCFVLVLSGRYKDACKGRLQQIDRSLARVMLRSEDAVKKLRLRVVRNYGD